jgi:hypothetical protein
MQPQVGEGIGVLVLLSLIVVSYVILRPVTDTPRAWTTAAPLSSSPSRS